MNYFHSLNLRADVFSVTKKLSENNVWVEKSTFWKSVWFSVKITNLKSKQVQYRFIAKWSEDFPEKFKVSINGQMFRPTSEIVIDRQNDLIVFFAEQVKGD